MRHLILEQKRWFSRFSTFLAAGVFCLALNAHAQDDQQQTPPPPPDQQDTVQRPSQENTVRAVRLSDVEGSVQILQGDQQLFDQAHPNMPVVEGMRLSTGSDGRVEMQFEDGSVARVTPNSSIALTQLRRSNDGTTITVINALNGLSYYELNGNNGLYSVKFGANTATPSGSTIFRIGLDSNPVELAVMHGTVHIEDGQNIAADVHTNQSIHFDSQNAGQYDVAQSIAADSWDQWNSDRDQTLAQLAANASTARASAGNPDDPGWSDLDYYGNWYNVPGYGSAWAPAGVGAGWDPFGSGYWGLYSGVGYTWISGYPWGWWPYRCGAWNWFPSNGWLWFPGNCGWGAFGGGGGWYNYPTVWRVPPGYKPPLRPIDPTRIHGPGPITHSRQLIVVNRGSPSTQQPRTFGQPKPIARAFNYNGQNINPIETSIRVRRPGPIGESFTRSAERTHPEIVIPRTSGFDSNNSRTVYQPGNGTVAPVTPRSIPNVPRSYPQPVNSRPVNPGGVAPRISPAPSGGGGAPRMSPSPPPSGGGGAPHVGGGGGGGGGGAHPPH